MKKYLLLLLILFIPFNVFAAGNGLQNLLKEDMIELSTTRILKGSRTGGASSTQSIEVTDKYLIIVQKKASEDGAEDNPIQVYDKNTLQYIKTISFNVGHGNDVTYNEKTNELMFLRSVGGRVTLVVLDADTLEYKKDINITFVTGAHAISYDKKLDKYFFASGNTGYITDSSFNVLGNFDIALNQTRQSLESYNGYLYYSNYEHGEVSQYQAVYDGVLEPTESVIYVFDKDGKYKSALYIPASSTDHLEIEGTAIDNSGNIFFLFNNWTTNEFEIYTVNYSKDSTVTVEVPIKSEKLNLNDYTFKANLYDKNNNLVNTYQNNNGKFKFNISLTNTGKHTYSIKQVDIENDLVNVDVEPINITITSAYALYNNKVNSTYTLSSSNFNNEEIVVEKREENAVVDEDNKKDEVIATPNLSSNASLCVIVFGVVFMLLGSLTVLIAYHNHKYNL